MPNDITIDHSLHGTLRIALEIAAERFDGYAAELIDRRVCDQFKLQAVECRQIIDLIDNA